MKIYICLLSSALCERTFEYFQFRDLTDLESDWESSTEFQDAVESLTNLFVSEYVADGTETDANEDLVPFLFNMGAIQDENFINFKNQIQQSLVEATLTRVQDDTNFMAANPDYEQAFIRNYVNGGNPFTTTYQAGL